jgi:hypothetical protein
MRDSSIKDIGYGAFSACHDLQHVFLSRMVEKISSEAFANASELGHLIVIPKSLILVGNNAFPSPYGTTVLFVDDETPSAERVTMNLEELVHDIEGDCWVQRYKVNGSPESCQRLTMRLPPAPGRPVDKSKLDSRVLPVKTGDCCTVM